MSSGREVNAFNPKTSLQLTNYLKSGTKAKFYCFIRLSFIRLFIVAPEQAQEPQPASGSEDSIVVLIPSFYLCVGSQDRTQVSSLVQQVPLPT